MKFFVIAVIALPAAVLAFGTPDIPDVLDADIPEIEIPGLDILDQVQVELNELIAATDSLTWLIPELATLDEVSAKLEELRETDPDVIGLQENLDALRAELTEAREELVEVQSLLTDDINEVNESLDTFMEGLPIPE